MREFRFPLLAMAWCACLAPACSILVGFDGFSGGPADERDGAAGDADAAGPSNDAAGESVLPDVSSADADASVGGNADGNADGDGLRPDSSTSDAANLDAADSADAADAAFCGTDLSNVGTGDFTIAMNLTTSQTGTVAIANQRAVCNNGIFWDVHLTNGNVQAETDDGTNHDTENTTAPLVNDGNPHSIVVQRRAEVLTVFVDGTLAGMTGSTSAFGPLPPLQTRTSPCVGHTNYFALVGMLSGVCVTSP